MTPETAALFQCGGLLTYDAHACGESDAAFQAARTRRGSSLCVL